MIEGPRDSRGIELIAWGDLRGDFFSFRRHHKCVIDAGKLKPEVGQLKFEPVVLVNDFGRRLPLVAGDHSKVVPHLVDFILAELRHVGPIIVLIELELIV